MVSERAQRQIDALLDEAASARPPRPGRVQAPLGSPVEIELIVEVKG